MRTSPTTAPALTSEQVADARDIFAAEPATRAVAFWTGPDDGDRHVWGQATADNRPARVTARIARWDIAFDPTTLVIAHRPRG
jgi:hypothetical protein